jgi:DNA processing protein
MVPSMRQDPAPTGGHNATSHAQAEAAALVALLRRGDRPWSHYANLVEAAGSAIAVLRGDYDDERDGDPERLFAPPPAPAEEPDLDAIAAEIRAWESEGMRFLTVLDPDYPANLRTIHNRPPFLFARGVLAADRDAQSVAVVGTRRPSPLGLEVARRMSAELVRSGHTVVSGLAAGIDTAAHTEALTARGRTVAVVGTGLRGSYPRKNIELQKRIATEGAVLSQFWPDAPASQQTFPMRNIVMSGFALATVVIEAAEKSGTRMQARYALLHGRPVFLHRILMGSQWAQSCARLPGAFVVEDADEVLSHLERLYSVDLEPA